MTCRLLYVVGQLRAGGLERQLTYLLQNMDRECYRPEVLVWNYNEEDAYVPILRSLGVPVHALPNASLPQKMLALRHLVQRLRPEIVHSYSFFTNFPTWCACILTHSLPLGSVRSSFIGDIARAGALRGKLSGAFPRAQVYNSYHAADNAYRYKSIFKPSKVLVVPNGMDLEKFQTQPAPTQGRTHILGIGSLIPLKRWERLIFAAETLQAKGYNFQIEIAGEGPLREELTRLAGEHGVSDRFHLLGYTSNIAELLDRAAFVVHTSDIEGCPNAVMEGLGAGRAVIAMGAGDVPRLIEHGKTGFIVPLTEDIRLTEHMEQLLSDRDFCREMGKLGRIKAQREFSLEGFVTKTLDAYRASGWKD